MKKNDFYLIGGLVLLAFFLFIMNRYGKAEGKQVSITVADEHFGTYLLSENQTIKISEHNTVQIKNQQVDMITADCPDQLCVKQKPISKAGECIICLPNQVVVTILGEKESDVDAIVN